MPPHDVDLALPATEFCQLRPHPESRIIYLMLYRHLNHAIPADAPVVSDAWRRVLNRLGEYIGLIAHTMNMRPLGAKLLDQPSPYVCVRLHLADHPDVVVRLAPEGHLSREIYFGRVMTAHNLPVARVLHADQSRSLVPFDYLIEHFIGGCGADQFDDPTVLQAVARQVGRTLRRMHRVTAPGWGSPGPTGRWLFPDWQTALAALHTRMAPEAVVGRVFDESEQAAIMALFDHPAMMVSRPSLVHGTVSLTSVRCTIGEHINLEALVEPGAVVGGDGMLDLARGINPTYPQAWRTGLVEGYVGLGPLHLSDQQRLWVMRLLVCCWEACQRFLKGKSYAALHEQTLALLAEIAPQEKLV